ncbi:hypothetical protein Cni_G20090 [Canna indica]|uniref:GDSL esterase/lipase n=1 Tax=Canna indica TaxID=4628 RepID=A0AAQ3KLX2_9LILI|nr:hypothetical protein Cni_G20090 [Canna indica]
MASRCIVLLTTLLLLLGSFLLLEISSASSSPCSFPAIFNFGDSNSDTGGLSAAFGAAPPPHGETFFGAPAGRYCDGRLIVDFIGIFKDVLPPQDYFSRALYTFDIGQNDLTAGYVNNMTTEEVKTAIPDILSKFVIVIKSVYGQGGRFFWIHNTGPFGCLPYVIERFPIRAPEVDRIGCGTPFNDVAQLFNAKLKQTVYKLRKDLPDAVFTYVDVYTVKYSLMKRARKLGFDDPLLACCGHGGRYNYNIHWGCGSKIKVNGTEVVIGKACENPLKRVCWDGVHYTEAANKWVYDRIVEGAFSDPPVPLRMACQRQA